MMDRIRFGGLGSGIDTHDMVYQLMRVERMRVDRFVQQEKRMQWRQEAIHEVNRKMANFVLDMRRSFGLNQVSYTGQFRAGDVNQFNWVKAARSSHEAAVTATASAGAMNGTHTVKVNKLASGASSMSVNLKEMEIAEGVKLLNEDGRTFSAAAASQTITFSVGEGEQRKEHTFTIGESGHTVGDLVRFMNNAASADGKVAVNAAYDPDVGSIMVNSRQTGANQIFSFGGGVGAELFQNVKAGENAEIEFNGQSITKAANNFSVFGINLRLKEADENLVTTISVSTDVDSVVDKIREFVDNYNNLLDDLQGKLNQTFYSDYPPLTDEQKQTMTDRDIDQWEDRARSGLLRNDESLNRMMQQLRSSLYEPVEGVTGTFSQITQLGITTGNFRDGGKLVIDEDKLRTAIANDVDGVMNLMFKTSGVADDAARRRESGLIQRINDGLVTGMQDLVRRGGTGDDGSLLRTVQGNMLIDFVTRQSSISQIQRDLMTLNQRIAREETALARKEQSYWDRFTAMEKAMGELNNQANWLMSQLGQW